MGFFGSLPVAGPVALVVITKGLNSDYRSALSVATGAALAEGVLAGLVFAGVGLAASRVGWLQGFLDVAGVAVLLLVGVWFAVRGLRGQGEPDESKDLKCTDPLRQGSFGAGLVLANPGLLGTWGGAVAGLEGTGWVQVSVSGAPFFGLGVCLGALGWFWLAVYAIKRWRSALNGKWIDVMIRSLGLGLIALGATAAYNLIRATNG